MPEFVLSSFENIYPQTDNTFNIGSSSLRWASIFGQYFQVYASSGDANPTASLQSGLLSFGAGGASALDTLLGRSGVARFYIQGVSGNHLTGLDIWATGTGHASLDMYDSSSDSQPTIRFLTSTQSISFGAGGASALELKVTRDANSIYAPPSPFLFQTLTSNSQTFVEIAPSGNNTVSLVALYATSDVTTNSSWLEITADQWITGFSIRPRTLGTGTLLPLVFGVNTTEAFRITTDPYTQFKANITAYSDNTVAIGTASVMFSSIYAHGLGIPINTLNNGLVGYWPLDEGAGTLAYDLSGTGNTGTLQNSPTWTTGKFGQALSFTIAGSKYVSMADTSFPTGASARTITFWLNTSASGANQYYFSYGTSASYKEIDIDMGSPSNQINIDINAETHLLSSLATVNDGIWHFIAVVVNSATSVTGYVDGIGQTVTFSNSINTTSSGVAYINKSIQGAYYSTSVIDDVRVYNRALYAWEILNLYNSYPVNPFVNSTALLLATANTWSAKQTFNAGDLAWTEPHGIVAGADFTTASGTYVNVTGASITTVGPSMIVVTAQVVTPASITQALLQVYTAAGTLYGVWYTLPNDATGADLTSFGSTFGVASSNIPASQTVNMVFIGWVTLATTVYLQCASDGVRTLTVKVNSQIASQL